MPAQLRVRFDGNVPGIAEHRLSLAAFGQPIAYLLQSLQRIATQMVSNAVDVDQPKAGGRLAKLARQLDIQITKIEGNSIGFDAVVSYMPTEGELPLIMDLPDRATIELLDSIEQESKGVPRNWSVRKYLQALPTGIREQDYELHDNGTSKKKVEIKDVHFTDIPTDLPSLAEWEGSIIGVGFDPGRSEVRIKSETSTPSLESTNEQVDAALQLRKAKIRALGVMAGKKGRLLMINRAREPRFKVTKEAIEEHIFTRWAGVFERLSKA